MTTLYIHISKDEGKYNKNNKDVCMKKSRFCNTLFYLFFEGIYFKASKIDKNRYLADFAKRNFVTN